MDNNKKVDSLEKKNIDYQFVAVPLNLFCRLDNNLRSMLFTLIQLQTYYAESDGWFFRSNEDLKAQANLSENLVRVTIDTLYKEGLIEVQSVGKGKGPNSPSNKYKVHLERFKDYEKDDIEKCIKDPRLSIETLKYKGSNYRPSYLDRHDDVVTAETTIVDDKVNTLVEKLVKSEDNINNIYNLNNISNINNINNLENKNNIQILDNKLNNNIEINYDIYKNRETWHKSLPREMNQSYYEKERLLFELYQLHDISLIEKKVVELEELLYRRRKDNEIFIEKTKYILDEKSKELGFKFSTIL